MPVQTTLMIIADIGGYTRFIRAHRKTLVHAHLVINHLLEAVIRSVKKRFELSKLEGDAAFFYTTVKGEGPGEVCRLVDAAVEVFRAFHSQLEVMGPNTLCGCEACTDIEKLRIKVVAHIGPALFTRIGRMTELAGEDVIRIHRMLKNDVPLEEYVLCSPEVTEQLQDHMRGQACPIEIDLEGFGSTRSYYFDLRELADVRPEPVRMSWPRRAAMYLWNSVLGLPYRLGIKEPLSGFRNVSAE